MIHKIVHYKVNDGKVNLVHRAISEFVAAIAREEPQTRYEAYAEQDGFSFVHTMSFPDRQAEAYHQKAPHTKKFVDILYPNCEEMPVFTDLRLVSSTEL